MRGTVTGVVAEAPRGSGGFGYDPIVVPVEGDGRTFAEMTADEKHAISHRARAFRALAGADYQPRRSTSHTSTTSSPSTTWIRSCMATVGSTWAGSSRTFSPTRQPRAFAPAEGRVLVGHEPAVADVDDGRVAVVHAEALQAAVGDAPGVVGGDHRAEQVEGDRELGRVGDVLGVHEAVAAGLHLGDPVVGRPRPGAAAGHDVAADVGERRLDQLAAACHLRRLRVAGLAHEVALVAHDARAPPCPWRGRGRRCGRPRPVSTPHRGMPTLTSTSTSVTPPLAAASTVSSESTAAVTRAVPLRARAPRRSADGAEHLVREQQVVAEAGRGHALHLADGGAAERAVARRRRAGGRARST